MPGRSRSRKTTYHHGNLRPVLIRAAAELASERGLAEFSLREVARRAGVSHTAPYHHFADREALLAAMASQGFEELDMALARAQDEVAPDPLPRLEALGVAYVRFALERPQMFRAMFRASSKEPGPEGSAAGPLGRLLSAVGACLATSPRPHADPLQPALVCWSAIHGLTALWLDGPIERDRGPQRDIEGMAAYVSRVLSRWIASGAPAGAAPRVGGTRSQRKARGSSRP
jgi:AcrR family transcriptional regulator